MNGRNIEDTNYLPKFDNSEFKYSKYIITKLYQIDNYEKGSIILGIIF